VEHYIMGKQFLFTRSKKWIFMLLSGVKRGGEDGQERRS
jgi:hypothetical protein